MEKDEVYLEKRARENWIKGGDRNTKFFHSQISQKRRINTIKCLEYTEGRRTDVEVEMENIAKSFFVNHFTSQRRDIGKEHIISEVEWCISKEDSIFLTSKYTEDGVVRALKDMGPTKAPGMDNFPTTFFQ